MNRLLLISALFLSLGLSAQENNFSPISKSELAHFLNDFYNGDRLIKKFSFGRTVYRPLHIELVQKFNAQFSVFDEKDLLFINNQIASYCEIELDTSYIPNADFVCQFKADWGTFYTTISLPLFNKTKDVCILFVTISGGLDPDEGIQIYKKRGQKWKLYKSLL